MADSERRPKIIEFSDMSQIMGENKMSESKQGAVLQVVEDRNVPEYHSNVIRITSGIYDFVFLFGQARLLELGGDAAIQEPVCAVAMSPAHAKAVFLLLRQQLRNYEQRWGEIPVDPGIEEKYGGSIDS